ncbi:hypothetical protein ACT691_10760 [Vibrio metschnikovii]
MSFSTPNAETLIEKPKVWLIERDIILAEYTMQQLESFGFRVKHLKDADELEHHTSESPDLLLIDHKAGQTEALKSEPVAFGSNISTLFPVHDYLWASRKPLPLVCVRCAVVDKPILLNH